MNLFQLITLPLIGFLLIRSAFRFFQGQQPRNITILAMAIWLLAGLAIYQPELTIRFAAILGIGRGADLVLYVLAISYVLTLWYGYNRFRKLESQMTEIVRYLAVRDAAEPDTTVTSPVKEGGN